MSRRCRRLGLQIVCPLRALLPLHQRKLCGLHGRRLFRRALRSIHRQPNECRARRHRDARKGLFHLSLATLRAGGGHGREQPQSQHRAGRHLHRHRSLGRVLRFGARRQGTFCRLLMRLAPQEFVNCEIQELL